MHISIRTTIGRQRNEMIIYYCMAEDGKESCSPASTRPVFSFQTDSCSLSKKKRIPAAHVEQDGHPSSLERLFFENGVRSSTVLLHYYTNVPWRRWRRYSPGLSWPCDRVFLFIHRSILLSKIIYGSVSLFIV
jgi:hypothetical protein